MGLRFRKSKNFGPFRVNLSKSGIGYSAGVKGFRVTKKARGGMRTTASIPGTGISSVKEYPSSASRRQQKKAAKAQQKRLAEARQSVRKKYGLSNRQMKKLEKEARRHPEKYAGMTDAQIMASVGESREEVRAMPSGSTKQRRRARPRSSGGERSGHSIWWYLFIVVLVIAVIRAISIRLFGK